MTLIAIDPGKLSIAWAMFDEDELRRCGLMRAKTIADLAAEANLALGFAMADRAVVEVPQIYAQRKHKGGQNDLIDVAVTAGIAVATLKLCHDVKLVRPRAWKGNRPKDVDNRLTLARLSVVERAVLDRIDVPKSLRHNVIDAIGIGLWALGRR